MCGGRLETTDSVLTLRVAPAYTAYTRHPAHADKVVRGAVFGKTPHMLYALSSLEAWAIMGDLVLNMLQ